MNPATEQKRVTAFLSGLLSADRIPNALLFSGESGMGQAEVALAFAMAQNCGAGENPSGENGVTGESRAFRGLFGKNVPCGACGTCRKIFSGNHPDVIFVRADGPRIKIGRIRALLDTLSMKAMEGKRRAVIIPEAGLLNREAANALLKVLEEPPEGTVFILAAREPSELLPTIVSRCQEIRFSPVPAKRIAECLVSEQGLSLEDAALYAALSRGSLDSARDLAENNGKRKRDWIADMLSSLCRARGADRIILAMALAEFFAKNRDETGEYLSWMRLWLRDRMVSCYDLRLVTNKDKLEALGVGPADPAGLAEKFSAVEACEDDIKRNVNARLACEGMFFALAAGA
jgi:DNA polymerase-3 subunit delta'